MTPFTTLMLFCCAANTLAGLGMIYAWGHSLMGIALICNAFLSVWLAHWAWNDKDVW